MPSSQTLAISCWRNQYGELTTGVSGSMGIEPIVVTPRAPLADGDASNTSLSCMLGDQRSEIDRSWSVNRAARQPLEHREVGAQRHLVRPLAIDRAFAELSLAIDHGASELVAARTRRNTRRTGEGALRTWTACSVR